MFRDELAPIFVSLFVRVSAYFSELPRSVYEKRESRSLRWRDMFHAGIVSAVQRKAIIFSGSIVFKKSISQTHTAD